ncbi:MAG: hypothetical protein HRU09_04305 [Oligoflexales bacterium]|nr:hypothetical protein [Oligoflexales bacterium]
MEDQFSMDKIIHISVKIGSGYNMLNKKDWLKLSKMDRIEKMTGGSVQFLNENGQAIPAVKALPLLKEGGWLD